MSDTQTKPQARTYPKSWRWHFREWRYRVRTWLLEDGTNGGPPNNWSSSGEMRSCGWGMVGDSVHQIRFGNDASELWISRKYDGHGEDWHWVGTYPTKDFHRIARWVLWRWAWGEWFGLRRWIYFKWLHRHVARMLAKRPAMNDRA